MILSPRNLGEAAVSVKEHQKTTLPRVTSETLHKHPHVLKEYFLSKITGCGCFFNFILEVCFLCCGW